MCIRDVAIKIVEGQISGFPLILDVFCSCLGFYNGLDSFGGFEPGHYHKYAHTPHSVYIYIIVLHIM